MLLKVSPTSWDTLPTATFGNHVVNVVCWSAKEKVSRIDAWRVVTTMKHTVVGGNVANEKLVRDAVSQQVSFVLASNSCNAVAVRIGAARPDNAASLSRVAEITEESFFERNELMSLLAILGAKSPSAKLDVAGAIVEVKATSAFFAGSVWFGRMTWHAGSPRKGQCAGADVLQHAARYFILRRAGVQ